MTYDNEILRARVLIESIFGAETSFSITMALYSCKNAYLRFEVLISKNHIRSTFQNFDTYFSDFVLNFVLWLDYCINNHNVVHKMSSHGYRKGRPSYYVARRMCKYICQYAHSALKPEIVRSNHIGAS